MLMWPEGGESRGSLLGAFVVVQAAAVVLEFKVSASTFIVATQGQRVLL